MEQKKIDFNTIAQLAIKIGEELRSPRQFLSPKRREELARNALSMLAGSVYRADVTTQQLEAEITEDLRQYQTANGIPFYLIDTSEYSFATHIFPDKLRMEYVPPSKRAFFECVKDTEDIVALLPSTTVNNGSPHNYYQYRIPSEGYMDHRGTLQEFKLRAQNDFCQHGGILISDDFQHIEIIPYHDLQEMKAAELVEGEALIEANWYMDSNNQNEVCARPNLQGRKVYSCIGKLLNKNGSSTIFTICTSHISVGNAIAERDRKPEYLRQNSIPCSMRSIAATCNYLAKTKTAIGWKVCGLEFHGGGPITDYRIIYDQLQNRDFFVFRKSRKIC